MRAVAHGLLLPGEAGPGQGRMQTGMVYLFRRLSGDREFDHNALTQSLMVCVDGRNLDLVRSLRKTSDNNRPAAGVGPDPRRAINRYMEMPDAGRHIEG